MLSLIGILGGMTPFISFGATGQTGPCTTCGSSPTNITLINNFTTEILANIRTIGTEAPYAGKHVPPSRFNSGKFTPPKQSIISKTLRRARESLGSVLAITRIHLELGDLANVGDSLGVLAGNKTILRDRNKMLKLEQDINRKKYELSVGGGWTDKIAGVSLQKMRGIIQRYQELGILTMGTIIDDGAEYGDLILLLGKVNASIKHVIALGGKERAKGEKEIIIELLTNGEVAIQIESEAIDQIKTDYDCTRRYACEQSRTNIKEEIKKMIEAIKSGVGNAQSEITKANQALTKAYSRESLQKVATEQTIRTQLSGTLNNISKRRERRKAEKEERENTAEIAAEVETKRQEMNQSANQNTEKEIAESMITTADKAQIINNFTARITDVQTKIKEDANQMKKNYETTDISDITTYFVMLSQKINGITNNIVGSKETDKSLIKNLGELCEKQCSNIGNKSCYY